MEQWEREIIRDLAKKKREIAESPEQKELVRLWTKHNDRQSERPMVHFEIGTVLDKGFQYECRCESEDARKIEWELGKSMQNYVMVGDDRVVTPDFYVQDHSGFLLFNLKPDRTQTEGIGFHINPVIEDLDTLDLIKPSAMWFDKEGINRDFETASDLFGDILEIKRGQEALYCCPTNDLVQRMSMENMFFSIYDNPENFLEMMDRLANDYVTYFKTLEQKGMLTPCCANNWLCQGTFAFSDQMKKEGPIMLSDVWGFMDSQETVNISPEMFDEFIFPTYQKISSLFGRLSYGCCEPVHPFWEKSLSRLENLRKISISPWCDEEYMGAALRKTGIIFQRKPSPLFIGGPDKEFDDDGFRKHIQKTMKAAEGCTLEITFRDVYNLNGNLGKPRRAVEIVREEIEKTWRG